MPGSPAPPTTTARASGGLVEEYLAVERALAPLRRDGHGTPEWEALHAERRRCVAAVDAFREAAGYPEHVPVPPPSIWFGDAAPAVGDALPPLPAPRP